MRLDDIAVADRPDGLPVGGSVDGLATWMYRWSTDTVFNAVAPAVRLLSITRTMTAPLGAPGSTKLCTLPLLVDDTLNIVVQLLPPLVEYWKLKVSPSVEPLLQALATSVALMPALRLKFQRCSSWLKRLAGWPPDDTSVIDSATPLSVAVLV